MCGKAHLLSVSASCGGQLPSDLAKPVICYNWLSAAREYRWVQPQKTGKVVNWGWLWWWWAFVVALVLDEHLHQGILLFDQLGEFWWKIGIRVTSWRHLMGLRVHKNLE